MLAKSEYQAMTHLIDRIGITPEHDCEYLKDQKSQLLVAMDPELHTAQGYQQLQQLGFRRSGNSLYRPGCPSCQACQSVRIDCAAFTPSRSQKRVLKQNQDIRVVVQDTPQPHYYDLFERYIAGRHADGSMHPTSREQYQGFLICHWLEQRFFEFWLEDELIGVAVTDRTEQMLSAVYTFYEPEQQHRSLGTFAILQQIQHCQANAIPLLYLGYQVNACQKMNYKRNFHPNQVYRFGDWCD